MSSSSVGGPAGVTQLTGVTLGGLAVAGLLRTKPLGSRNVAEIAAVSTVAFLGAYGLGVGTEAGIESVDHHTALSRTQSQIAFGGAGAVTALSGAVLAARGQKIAGGALMTAGATLGASAALGASWNGIAQLAPGPIHDAEHWTAPALGGIGAAGVLAVVAKKLPMGLKAAAAFKHRTHLPDVEGELIPRSKLGMLGATFMTDIVDTGAAGNSFEHRRTYVPLKLADPVTGKDLPKIADRIAVGVQQMEDQGAWAKHADGSPVYKYFNVAGPTGSGSVHQSAMNMSEQVADANTWSIAAQYGTGSSIKAELTDRTPVGVEGIVELNRQLARKTLEHFGPGSGPVLRGNAVSLGALTWVDAAHEHAQEMFGGDSRLDKVVLFGDPQMVSPFRDSDLEDVIGPDGKPLGPGSVLHVTTTGLDYDQLDRDAFAKARMIIVNHYDDPITKLGFSDFVTHPLKALSLAGDVFDAIARASPPAVAEDLHDYRKSSIPAATSLAYNPAMTRAQVDAQAAINARMDRDRALKLREAYGQDPNASGAKSAR